MNWDILIVSSLTLIFYISIIGFLVFIIGRFFIRFWRQKLKFILKYTIFRSQFDEIMVKECYDAIDKNMDTYDLKMHLLVNNFKLYEINEILFVFNKIKQELGMKGGLKKK